MVREIVKDEAFLSQRAEIAGSEDLAAAQDLLETLAAHRDSCVGLRLVRNLICGLTIRNG